MTSDTSSPDRLYRDTVLEHSRNPHHFGRIADPDAQAEGHNPLCGDKVAVYLRLDGERITDAAFEASGCAISIASASMMTDIIHGRSKAAAQAAIRDADATFTGDCAAPPGELAALAAVRAYPSRVRCALLPWRTLRAALDDVRGTISTEQGD
jgi:nitrogen fixation NifU-like protein